MQSEIAHEQGPVLDDPAEIVAGQNRELIQGPIADLVDFFGLGSRVIAALEKLDCETGLYLICLNINKVYLFAGETTGRRISLLREWVQLKVGDKNAGVLQTKQRDIAGPSEDKKKNAVTSIMR